MLDRKCRKCEATDETQQHLCPALSDSSLVLGTLERLNQNKPFIEYIYIIKYLFVRRNFPLKQTKELRKWQSVRLSSISDLYPSHQVRCRNCGRNRLAWNLQSLPESNRTSSRTLWLLSLFIHGNSFSLSLQWDFSSLFLNGLWFSYSLWPRLWRKGFICSK